jgi:hypothetical protein
MKINKGILLLILEMAAMLCILGCSTSLTDGGGSGTEVGVQISGSLIDNQGQPVSGAIIRLRTDDYLADTTQTKQSSGLSLITKAETTTDSLGNFRIDSVDTGKFTIEANYQNSHGAVMTCENVPTEHYTKIPTAVINPLATISGSIKMDPIDGASRTNSYVKIFGLERITKADSLGRFSLKVPAGSFNLRIVSDTIEYSPLDTQVKVVPDQHMMLDRFDIPRRPPPQPSMSLDSDTTIIRTLLDSLKHPEIAVNSVITVRNGRVAELNLRNLGIQRLNPDFARLITLEKLDLGNNLIYDEIPFLSALRNLRILILSNNKMRSINRDIGSLRQLEQLDVSNNELAFLPDSIISLKPAMLDLSYNSLGRVPPAVAAWADTYDPDWKATQRRMR